jgi:hypothetical protein
LEDGGSFGGSGSVVVTSNGDLTLSDGGQFTISADFDNQGSVSVSDDSTLVLSGSGSCSGSFDLGSVLNGGNLEITGDYQLTCGTSGAGGSLTFNSATTRDYAINATTYTLAKLHATGHSVVTATANTINKVVISGKLIVSGSAQFVVDTSVQVSADVTVTADATLEIVSGGLSCAQAKFNETATYVVHVASETIAKLEVSGEAEFEGTIQLKLNNFEFEESTQVTVVTYASHSGAFGTVDASNTGSASARRSLLGSGDVAVNYEDTKAVASASGSSGASTVSVSVGVATVAGLLALY